MAGFGFGAPPPPVPGQPVMQGTRPSPPTEMQQSSGFTDILRAPEVQAALIQFGINMLQPSYGGFGGQLGKSLGAAGAAAGRAAGQKAEAEERAQRRDLQEREFGLAERRTKAAEKRESRLGGGKGLQSLFSKPKPFSEWVTVQANKAQADTALSPEGQTKADDLLRNKEWMDEQYRIWQSMQQMGGGGTGGISTPVGPPKVGEVQEGYRFLGGDPGNEASWEKV